MSRCTSHRPVRFALGKSGASVFAASSGGILIRPGRTKVAVKIFHGDFIVSRICCECNPNGALGLDKRTIAQQRRKVEAATAFLRFVCDLIGSWRMLSRQGS